MCYINRTYHLLATPFSSTSCIPAMHPVMLDAGDRIGAVLLTSGGGHQCVSDPNFGTGIGGGDLKNGEDSIVR
jgi:hypothetical protein